MKLSYELNDEEFEALPEDHKAKYKRAIDLCRSENAGGPFGGWADGQDILIEMGWKVTETKVDHRIFRKLGKP